VTSTVGGRGDAWIRNMDPRFHRQREPLPVRKSGRGIRIISESLLCMLLIN